MKAFLANPLDESNPLFGTDQDFARNEVREMEEFLDIAIDRI